jgi:hypothetical protein
MAPIQIQRVLDHLGRRQCLHPAARDSGVVQLVHDIVGLHASDPVTIVLSAWARVEGFERGALERALGDERSLFRTICMRKTLFVVSASDLPVFFQAFSERHIRAEQRRNEQVLVLAGLCGPEEAAARLEDIEQRVMEAVERTELASARDLGEAVPELRASFSYAPDKPYGGKMGISTRILYLMCLRGRLVRARPRGTWKSTKYDYASLSDWLPQVDLDALAPAVAREKLVRAYLRAFGPATLEDIYWWTGFTKGQTRAALKALCTAVVEVEIAGLEGPHLVLADDLEEIRTLTPFSEAWVSFLPALDPYVMGYKDRRRFLAVEHHPALFDRSGNAGPTVWIDGRVVGGWATRKDGSVAFRLFERRKAAERALVEAEARRLEEELGGERVAPRFLTPLAKELARG